MLSLLSQKTTFDYEVIVCDDCSTDQSLKIIDYLATNYNNLVVLKNRSNSGLIATMKYLLSSAKGQYIAYLDGDDVALPSKLQQQVDYLNSQPECSMVYHESEVFEANSGRVIKYFSRDFYNFKYIPQQANIEHLIRFTIFLQASSIMFRRHSNLLDALEHDNRIICDYPWHIMNLGLNSGTVDRIDNVLGRYRIHANSFGGQTQRNVQRRLQVTEELVQACRLGNRFAVNNAVVQSGVNHVYFSAALYFLRQREFDLFRNMIEQSVTEHLYFDERHIMAYQYRASPSKLCELLGWSS